MLPQAQNALCPTRLGARGKESTNTWLLRVTFIELEQDSCYCRTVTLTLCKPRLAALAEREATDAGPRTWDGAQQHLLHEQD